MANTKIVSEPKILKGKPVIAGTRISVELIMNFLGAGMSVDDLLKEYTELRKEEILEAIKFAAKAVSRKQSSPIRTKNNLSLPLKQ